MIQVGREAKRTPAWAQEEVTRAGGRNRFGEPNFRIVWGWSRLGWIGGEWEDRDEAGEKFRQVTELRRVPKYFPFDRWHLERWLPPEAYGSPEEWYRGTVERSGAEWIATLGPFPDRGEWEHCLTLQTPGGGFLPLTPGLCRQMVLAIERSRSLPGAERRAALQRAAERRERDYEAHVDDVLWNEPRFHAQPYVTVGGAGSGKEERSGLQR